jgi:hypothetical protein
MFGASVAALPIALARFSLKTSDSERKRRQTLERKGQSPHRADLLEPEHRERSSARNPHGPVQPTEPHPGPFGCQREPFLDGVRDAVPIAERHPNNRIAQSGASRRIGWSMGQSFRGAAFEPGCRNTVTSIVTFGDA